MKRIEVKIRQKEKGLKDLSLFNLRDEVVNFLYRDTVANSTKSDLHFFVLLYFIAVKNGNKTFLEMIFDEGIPKFNKLNEAFFQQKRYLPAQQYRKMVEEYGLLDLFENDLFFVLIEAVLNIDEIKTQYKDFLKIHPDIERILGILSKNYTSILSGGFQKFQSKRIRDDRHDENGNYHDLSKSVYRTIRMRNSRNFDLNLQKYTSVRELTSRSPIDLTFLQYADPQIIFDLWDRYHVAGYMKSVWQSINNSPVLAGATGSVLAELVIRFSKWKSTSGKMDQNEKRENYERFEEAKQKSSQVLDDLTLQLVNSVLRANVHLEEEIRDAKDKLRELNEVDNFLGNKKSDIKKLEDRIEQLENLVISTRLIEDDKNKDTLTSK